MSMPPATAAAKDAEDFSTMQLVAMIFVVCTGFSSQMVMPLWIGAIIESLAISEKAAGAIASTEFAAVAIVSVTVATQVNRLNGRLTVAIGLALLTLGNLLAAYAETTSMLTVFRIMTGCGKGLVVAIIFGLCAGTRNPTRTFATLNVSYAIFATVFYLGIPPAIIWQGPAGAFLAMAAVAVAGAVFMIWFPARRLQAQEKIDAPFSAMPLYGFLALGAMILIWMGHGAVWTFLERLGAQVGLSVADVGKILSLGAFVTIGGPLLARFIDTRFGNTTPVFAASFILLVSVLMIVYPLAPWMYSIAVPLFLLMALFSVPYIMGILSIADPSGRLAAASSAAMTAGGSLGALSGGLTVDQFGYSGLGWMAGLLFVIVLIIIASISSSVRKAAAPAAV